MAVEIKIPTDESMDPKTGRYRNPFDAVLNKSQEKPVVVQFFAKWCGPCKVLKPHLKKVAKDTGDDWALAFVDVEKHKLAAINYNIRSVPTVKMFYKGEAIASFKGTKPAYIIKNWLDRNLPEEQEPNPYETANGLLRNGDVQGASIHLLEKLVEDNAEVPILKILLALQHAGKNNPQAMTIMNQVKIEGDHQELAKRVRDLIDMEMDEADTRTPNHSPYNPSSNSANDLINVGQINEAFLCKLIEDMVNEVRESQGVGTVQADSILVAAARDQNQYQLQHDILSHYQKDEQKKDVGKRVGSFGGDFRTVGENVQYQSFQVIIRNGQKGLVTESYIDMAQKMVRNWVHSPGHYKNMINPDFQYVGTAIGWNPENHAIFATQVFGG